MTLKEKGYIEEDMDKNSIMMDTKNCILLQVLAKIDRNG